ncbi:MAG: prephenate dehydratase domain-containing protein [Patescibacteria group bacterium]
MKLAALGPEGTYSSQAAREYDPEAELVLASTIPEAIAMVASGDCRRGLIPLENSIEGTVRPSFDGLFDHGLFVHDEHEMEISHTLWGTETSVTSDDVMEVHSHEQALGQCREYLDRNYPKAVRVPSASTAAAIKRVAKSDRSYIVAIGPDFAGRKHGLSKIDEAIEDQPNNITQFVAFSKQPKARKPLGFTLVALIPEKNRPGLLRDIATVIEPKDAAEDRGDIDMSRFEARPSRTKLGEYIFYARLEMPSDDPRFETLVDELADMEDGGVLLHRMTAES